LDREQEAIETYLRVFAWVLLAASLLPFDFYGSDPVWPWAGLLDGNWADRLALCTPVLASLLFFFLARRKLHKLTISAILLGCLAWSWLVYWWSALGPHSLAVFAHITDGLPSLFSRAFWLLLMGITLLATGIRLGAKGFRIGPSESGSLTDPWGLARILTASGVVLVILFYLLPYRGNIPIQDLISGIVELGQHLDQPTGLALMAGHVLSLGPLLFAVACLIRLWRKAPEHGGMLVALILAFVPVLTLLVGLRNFAILISYTLLHVRAAALILATTVGATLALATLFRGSWYEVPWTFGRFTRIDRRLASLLLETETQDSLTSRIRKLPFIIRPFVFRRLALWKAAAAQVPGAGQNDLSRVMQFLIKRWQEEKTSDEELVDKWPAWIRVGWLYGTLATVLFLCGGLTWLAAWRADPGRVCVLEQQSPELAEIFTTGIPDVIIELSRQDRQGHQPPSLTTLRQALAEAEKENPGIEAGVLDLLDLGAYGRRRLHSIWRARDRLNFTLHKNHIPYFVRSRVRSYLEPGAGDLFYLLTYRIIECRVYEEKNRQQRIPVLHLVRADPLNIIEQYVGATVAEEAFVSILVDRVDEFIYRRMAPAVDWNDAVGDAIRKSVLAVSGSLEELQEGVDGPLGILVIEGLTRHELHHKWLGLNPEPPTAVWAWMSGYSEDAVRGVTAEIGAYLGELSFSPVYARLRIALMIAALHDSESRHGAHGYARVFLLAKLFDVDMEQPLRLQVLDILAQASALGTTSDAELIDKFDALHQELFGTAVPHFELVDNPGDE